MAGDAAASPATSRPSAFHGRGWRSSPSVTRNPANLAFAFKGRATVPAWPARLRAYELTRVCVAVCKACAQGGGRRQGRALWPLLATASYARGARVGTRSSQSWMRPQDHCLPRPLSLSASLLQQPACAAAGCVAALGRQPCRRCLPGNTRSSKVQECPGLKTPGKRWANVRLVASGSVLLSSLLSAGYLASYLGQTPRMRLDPRRGLAARLLLGPNLAA